MSDDWVTVERHGRVLLITMNRPKANAINYGMSRAMYSAFEQLQNDDTLSVGVLNSSLDRIFSGGWDLKEAARDGWDATIVQHPEHGYGPGGFGGITDNWALDKPVIAAVHGAAVGGGFEIALACDIILMAEDSFFQLPEMARGFLPDVGGWQRLTRKIPYNAAVELLLTGRRLEAAEAIRLGLVHKAVPKSDLIGAALDLASQIADGAPLALRALKAMLQATAHLDLRDAMARTRPGQSQVPTYEAMIASEDFHEGIAAFVERRAPVWKAR